MAGPHDGRPGDGAGAAPAPSSNARHDADDLGAIRGRMTGLVRRTCPAWLADQAEDIVQTAMARVLEQRRKTGDPEPASPSYLMKAAYNATIDEIRRKFRHVEIPDGETGRLASAAGRSPDPERAARGAEVHRGIRECLAALAQARRSAVTLHLLGYSLRETAESFGWTRKRAEHLIYRGLGDLRRCLSEKGLEP